MGDLGTDAGQSALSLGAKALEAILKLFEKLMDAWENRHKRELDKIRLKEAKVELDRQKILAKLDGKAGWVNYQDLKRSGLETTPIGVFMTKAEMKELSAICKREGVLFSGITSNSVKNENGVRSYELLVKTQDLERINRIVDRMNDEKMIAGIDNRIAELMAKGDKMTEQDRVDVAALQEQKAAIQRGYCEKLNDETARNVIDKAVTGEVGKKLTLDEALNRLTGRSIDRDVVTIVADANDPSKYIKCHGHQDVYNDKPYIKTEYEVFRGTQSVLKTHDGRFDGRPEGYWAEQKAAIQQAGEFSGTFLKFYSVVEFQKWAEAARTQNTQELSSMSQDGEKNYSGIIKELEAQLDKSGAAIKEGKVVDKATGEPVAIAVGMTSEQQAIVAEAMVIGKQIKNYQEIQQLSEELSLAKAEALTTDDGTPERDAAEANLSNLEGRYNAALEKEQELITERKEINAVQAEQEVRNSSEHAKEIEYLPEDKAKIQELESEIQAARHEAFTMEEAANASDDIAVWRKEMAQVEVKKTEIAGMEQKLERLKSDAVYNAEHPDERRGDRIAEKDTRKMTMEEVKSKIAEQRAKDGAKANDVKDRNVHDQKAKAAVSKTSHSHTHADR